MRRGIRAEYRRDNANRRHVIHPNEINQPRVIHPHGINHPHVICPNETNRPRIIHPTPSTTHAQSTQTEPTVCAQSPKRNRRGGAYVPARASAQRRFHTKKTHALCAGNLTMDAPLQGDTGGHTGAAPTKLHHIFPHNPTQTK